MSWIIMDDPDEWENYAEYRSYGTVHGVPMYSMLCGKRRRPPEEVARIKAEKQRLHEEAVLAEADAIRARRAQKPTCP